MTSNKTYKKPTKTYNITTSRIEKGSCFLFFLCGAAFVHSASNQMPLHMYKPWSSSQMHVQKLGKPSWYTVGESLSVSKKPEENERSQE